MIFERGQTLSFHGSDAIARADALVKEEGADMVEVLVRQPGRAKVRLLRQFVLESQATQRLHAEQQSNLLCRS